LSAVHCKTTRGQSVMKRRELVKAIAGTSLTPMLLGAAQSEPVHSEGDSTVAFLHGVASGDPLADRVILWTRVTPAGNLQDLPVRWEISATADFSVLLDYGSVNARSGSDYTVKVDVANLRADTRYYYRFYALGNMSPTGTTRTLPLGAIERIRLAVVSCSNYPAGYFNVYRALSQDSELNAVIHLGDYLYEYGMGGYATQNAASTGRVPEPKHETTHLADYRQRHGQYKRDPDLQAVHACHPMICVWDDHEIANNAWTNGSPHTTDTQAWLERKADALQAYFEWMPVRENPETGINRRFDFGDLASLLMLDTRLKGRERQVGSNEFAAGQGRDRQILGKWQESWLEHQLRSGPAPVWTLVGQQVMVSPLLQPDLRGIADPDGDSEFERSYSREVYNKLIQASARGLPLLLDAWDGYPEARERFLSLLQRYGRNNIVLTGDIHTGISSELFLQDRKTRAGYELITPSVTSPGLDDYFPSLQPGAVAEAFMDKNPHISYLNGKHKGWLQLDLSRQQLVSRWMTVDNIASREFNV